MSIPSPPAASAAMTSPRDGPSVATAWAGHPHDYEKFFRGPVLSESDEAMADFSEPPARSHPASRVPRREASIPTTFADWTLSRKAIQE